MKLIQSSELCKQTGATYRQIDYWCSQNIIEVATENKNPGTGHPRMFDVDIVPKVTFLVKLSKTLGIPPPGLLKACWAAYHYGMIYLGEGITITWEK